MPHQTRTNHNRKYHYKIINRNCPTSPHLPPLTKANTKEHPKSHHHIPPQSHSHLLLPSDSVRLGGSNSLLFRFGGGKKPSVPPTALLYDAVECESVLILFDASTDGSSRLRFWIEPPGEGIGRGGGSENQRKRWNLVGRRYEINNYKEDKKSTGRSKNE